jgi:hypothetical protein
MALEVINVLKPFLAFVVTFNVALAHNMCALQLDPRFKGSQCIMEYVGMDKTTTIVEKYDHQVLMSLLVVVSKHLNLGNVENLPPLAAIANDSLWGVATSIGNGSLYVAKSKLS